MRAAFVCVCTIAFAIFADNVHSLPNPNGGRRRGEILINPQNRDVCLAKLICGMTASGTIEEDLQNYGKFAQIIDRFIQENPLELNQENMDMLEDYSMSSEHVSDPKRRKNKRPLFPIKPRPSIVFNMEEQSSEEEPSLAMIMQMSTPNPIASPNSTLNSSMEQTEVQSPKKPVIIKTASMEKHASSGRDGFYLRRMANAKVIKDIQAKLKVVRQCKEIGCSYTFKELFQKYSNTNGDEGTPAKPIRTRNPIRNPKPQTPQFSIPQYAPPPQLKPPKNSYAQTGNLNVYEDDDESFEEESGLGRPILGGFLQSPAAPKPQLQSPLAGLVESFDKIQQQEQRVQSQARPLSFNSMHFQGQGRPVRPPAPQPLPSYKVKNGRPTAHSRPQRPIWGSNGGEPSNIRPNLRPSPTPEPTAPIVISEQATSTTAKPKRKNIKRKPRPPNPDDDEAEEDDINKTAVIKLIGNPNFDVAPSNENEDDEQDDYDEEEKFEVSVEYGNDDEDDDDESEEEIKVKTPKKKKNTKAKSKSGEESTEIKLFPPAFPDKKTVRKENKKIKKMMEKIKVEEEDTTRKTTEDDDDDDDLERDRTRNEGPSFATQIGGRPMFPTGDIPISMSFGSTRPRVVQPPWNTQARNNPPPQQMAYSRPASAPSSYSSYTAAKPSKPKYTPAPVRTQMPQQTSITHGTPAHSNVHAHGHSQTQSPQQHTNKGSPISFASGLDMLNPIQNIFKNSNLKLISNPFSGMSMGGGQGQGQAQIQSQGQGQALPSHQQTLESKPPPHSLHPLPYRTPGPESNNFKRKPEPKKVVQKVRTQSRPKIKRPARPAKKSAKPTRAPPVVRKPSRYPSPRPGSSNHKRTKPKGNYNLNDKNKKVKRVTRNN